MKTIIITTALISYMFVKGNDTYILYWLITMLFGFGAMGYYCRKEK